MWSVPMQPFSMSMLVLGAGKCYELSAPNSIALVQRTMIRTTKIAGISSNLFHLKTLTISQKYFHLKSNNGLERTSAGLDDTMATNFTHRISFYPKFLGSLQLWAKLYCTIAYLDLEDDSEHFSTLERCFFWSSFWLFSADWSCPTALEYDRQWFSFVYFIGWIMIGVNKT